MDGIPNITKTSQWQRELKVQLGKPSLDEAKDDNSLSSIEFERWAEAGGITFQHGAFAVSFFVSKRRFWCFRESRGMLQCRPQGKDHHLQLPMQTKK